MKKNTRRRRDRASKPASAQVCVLRIDDLSRAGAGVAKDDSGRVIFVPYTAPGDVVKAKIISRKSKFAQAQLLEVLEPSPHRQEPKCPVFGQCGGCEWQHIDYELQWRTKSRGVKEALQRFKIPLPASWEEYPAGQIWAYRNRIQLRGNKDVVGYYAKASHAIVAIDHCAIARDELNAQIPVIRQLIRQLIRQQGQSRTKPYKVELEVAPNGTVRSLWDGAAATRNFQQVNTDQNQQLKNWVFKHINKHQPLIDLYGGSANLSAQLAPYAPHIDCVDLAIPQDTAGQWPENIAFHESDVFTWVVNRVRKEKAKSMEPQAIVAKYSAIIDPPRGGMPEQLTEFIHALQQLNVNELIAVGCKTDTWARDLAGFADAGWRVDKAAVFDFFPQTAHVESAALLRRDGD